MSHDMLDDYVPVVDVLSSPGVHHFFDGHTGFQTSFVKAWPAVRQDIKGPISFVRIIICTAGFTDSQMKVVKEHNEARPNQPVLLANATHRIELFGKMSAEAILRKVGSPTGTRTSKPTQWDRGPWTIPPFYLA
jgi:hypothetical protein